ncbi:MAG TPA: DUF167 domain-containing protein [Ramlibacter sp.]|nr:DUF167 domain-containing protein [Ramlibacter sp.]
MKTLQLKVKPNARQSLLIEPAAPGAPWTAQLKAPPVDGKANEELVALLARHFGCAKAAVRIKAGASGRMKLVQIDGVD